ncbi:tetratricopeptide repeat protein [Nocardia colli]|uniref:tetratricopeptide repeat protein n=1 Tax=Nocardia colli TaxID=2545717 RepID=UPI0035DA3703
MNEPYSSWAARNSPDDRPLAARYQSAEPIVLRGSKVYPMYTEQVGPEPTTVTVTLLSAAPPAGLRGLGMGLSVVDGYVGLNGRRLAGVDVWSDALVGGISFDIIGTAPVTLVTLTPVWVDGFGEQKSWVGNYGIVIESAPDGRTILWCSIGEGPANFANLVVDVTTSPAAVPAQPHPALDAQHTHPLRSMPNLPTNPTGAYPSATQNNAHHPTMQSAQNNPGGSAQASPDVAPFGAPQPPPAGVQSLPTSQSGGQPPPSSPHSGVHYAPPNPQASAQQPPANPQAPLPNAHAGAQAPPPNAHAGAQQRPLNPQAAAQQPPLNPQPAAQQPPPNSPAAQQPNSPNGIQQPPLNQHSAAQQPNSRDGVQQAPLNPHTGVQQPNSHPGAQQPNASAAHQSNSRNGIQQPPVNQHSAAQQRNSLPGGQQLSSTQQATAPQHPHSGVHQPPPSPHAGAHQPQESPHVGTHPPTPHLGSDAQYGPGVQSAPTRPMQTKPATEEEPPSDTSYRTALYDLGVAMYGRGEEDQACGLWAQAADAGHAGAAYDLGVVRFRRGDLDDAERWWRTAADRREPRAMAGLAELLDRQGNYAEARVWRACADEERVTKSDQSVSSG